VTNRRRIALIATEPSGDRLGAGLIRALEEAEPGIECFGMAGPRMRAQGCEPLAEMESVAVMGIVEVLARYPELRRIRRRLVEAIAARRPDVVVGIDAPDFNLGALALLGKGPAVRVQFVSPQVWAWRRGRVRTVARAVDLLLTIFPFEPALYEGQPIDTRFVGHPIADEIPPERDVAGARRALELPAGHREWLAVLPGSRAQEIRHNAAPFFAAAATLARARSTLGVVCPYLNAGHLASLEAARLACAPDLAVAFREQCGREALAAADVALVASGTATLEGLLSGTPLVVGYRMPWLNYAIMRTMVRVPFIAMPNLLAEQALVPEFVQGAMTPEALTAALGEWFESPPRRAAYAERARALSNDLRRDASRSAARAILAAGRAG